MSQIIDFNLGKREYNCDARTLTDKKECWFGNKCRRSVVVVVYNLYCRLTGKTYYGRPINGGWADQPITPC